MIAGLAEPAVFDDWLLLAVRTRPPAEEVAALRLASDSAGISDRVFLVGCPYSERDCAQNVYRGRVTHRDGSRFWYSLDPPVDVRGFSGAPILNEAGRVVGIFSVTEELQAAPDGLQVEGEGDDTLVRHAASCARSASR